MPAAESQIRINTLLLEREALFLRVHDLEQAVDAIFGEPFPFTRPALPSDHRSKKPGKKAKPAAAAPAALKLRKLEAPETAYRVTYRQGDQVHTEEHDTPDALHTLLAAQGRQLEVRSIETLDQSGTPQARLFGTATSADEPPSKV